MERGVPPFEIRAGATGWDSIPQVVFGIVGHWAECQPGQWRLYCDSKYLCVGGIVAADAHVLVN